MTTKFLPLISSMMWFNIKVKNSIKFTFLLLSLHLHSLTSPHIASHRRSCDMNGRVCVFVRECFACVWHPCSMSHEMSILPAFGQVSSYHINLWITHMSKMDFCVVFSLRFVRVHVTKKVLSRCSCQTTTKLFENNLNLI